MRVSVPLSGSRDRGSVPKSLGGVADAPTRCALAIHRTTRLSIVGGLGRVVNRERDSRVALCSPWQQPASESLIVFCHSAAFFSLASCRVAAILCASLKRQQVRLRVDPRQKK